MVSYLEEHRFSLNIVTAGRISLRFELDLVSSSPPLVLPPHPIQSRPLVLVAVI